MNIFTKAKIVKILNDKVQSGEICSFNLTDLYLRISKSKRTGITLKFSDFSDVLIINLLKKKTPNPSIENIQIFYQRQIKKIK